MRAAIGRSATHPAVRYAREVHLSVAFDRTLWALCGSYSGAGSQPKLYVRSFDGGGTWERPRPGYYGGYSSKLQAISEHAAWAAGVKYPLVVTRNGGARWLIAMSRHDDGGWTDVTFTDAQHGWAVFRYLVLRTVDGGTTWQQSLVARAGRPLPKDIGLCPEENSLQADVNGDGLEDLISYDYIRGAVLTVCTARGSRDRINTSGMSELLEIVDIQEDGQAEILYGGTTCCARLAYLATVKKGTIRTIAVAKGEPLQVDSGLGEDPSRDGPLGRAYGCRDDDGDGAKDLVLVTVRPTREKLRWVEQVFEIEGASAVLLSEKSGTTPRRGGVLSIQVVKAATELAPAHCKIVATHNI